MITEIDMKLLAAAFAGILLSLNVQSVLAAEPVFSADEHCLAYRTSKKMFFFADVEVVGKSCDFSVLMQWSETPRQARVQVRVPVSSLDSDNSLRDESVIEILDAERFPEIIFVSEWMTEKSWQEKLSSGKGTVFGTLDVGGKPHPVNFSVVFSDQPGYISIRARLKTTFSAFDLEVPTIRPGGMLADISEDLELLAGLRSDRIDGPGKITAYGN